MVALMVGLILQGTYDIYGILVFAKKQYLHKLTFFS